MVKDNKLISSNGKVYTVPNEFNFLLENEHLGDNLALVCYSGSLAYGTNLPTSDIDIRGVALRSKEDILSGEDWCNVKMNEPDVCIYSFDKMINLLLKSNPNTLELLGLRDKDYLYKSEIGQLLIDNRKLFLSKECIGAFNGYANGQLYRLRQKTKDALSEEDYNKHIQETIDSMYDHLIRNYNMPDAREQIKINVVNGKLTVDINNVKDLPIDDFISFCKEINNVVSVYYDNSKRNKNAIEHQKVDKHVMHLLRVYMEGIDILEQQEIITYREKEHDLLMDIRLGTFSDPATNDPKTRMMNKDFWDLLAVYEAKFQQAIKTTKLPDKPDVIAIHKLRLKVLDMIVSGKEHINNDNFENELYER